MHVHFPEPSLAELLDDPLVQLLMTADGVEEAALRNLIGTIRQARRTSRDDDVSHAGKGHDALQGGPSAKRLPMPRRRWRPALLIDSPKLR